MFDGESTTRYRDDSPSDTALLLSRCHRQTLIYRCKYTWYINHTVTNWLADLASASD